MVNISKRISSSTRYIEQFKNQYKYDAHFVSTTEIDSHADTHCFGANFLPILFAGKVCDVGAFSDTFHTLKDIPICTACTAIDDPVTGITTILEFPQGVWMGDTMKHSLINPNQCRAYGIKIQDDPYDVDKLLSIQDPVSDIVIPLTVQGSTILMKTRAPTNDEIMNSTRYIVMSSDAEWDPTEVESFFLQQYNHNKSQPHFSQVIVSEESYLHDDSREAAILAGISTALSDHTMLRELDENAKIKIQSNFTSARHSSITPEHLSDTWRISLDNARKTLKVTTQYGVRHAVHPLRKRYKTDIILNKYRRLNTTFYTDTMISKYNSLNNNKYAQVFCNKDVIVAYPISSKSHAGFALQKFIEDIGVPTQITCDGAGEQVGPKTEFMRLARKNHIKVHRTEAYTPKQNLAEPRIGDLRKRWRDVVASKSISPRLWDYGIVYEAEILSRICRGSDKRSGLEVITGDTPDISQWLDFGFYDPVWYWDAPYSKEDTKKRAIGRWLGVSHNVGGDMCYWVLTGKGKVVSRTTVQHITQLESSTPEISQALIAFDQSVKGILNDANHLLEEPDTFFIEDVLPEENALAENEIAEADSFTPDTVDEYLNAEIKVAIGGEWLSGRVTKRVRNEDGTPVGLRHKNPLLDTREYVVELSDGTEREYFANVIAQNIYMQCDSEGRQHMSFNSIIDHRKDGSAIPIDDGFTYTKSGNRVKKMTTRGWDVLIEWKDQTTSWLPLKEVKASNPIELAEYAQSNNLMHEPAFAWWAPYTLKKKARMIGKVRSRYWKTHYKFGFRLPHSVEEALAIDAETGTTFWRDALEKEMKHVIPAFEEWEEGDVEEARKGKKLIGYQEIKCHTIFDIKMENFQRKARFVAGGHTTQPPDSITYSSVVARDSVRIAMLVAALNDLDLCAADIGNAYLNANCREKIWTVAGPEFGSNQGKAMIIRKALYGLKSSGAAWRSLLASTLREMNFKSTTADPDTWIRPAVKANGFEYYEMILVYVDDILCVSHDSDSFMNL